MKKHNEKLEEKREKKEEKREKKVKKPKKAMKTKRAKVPKGPKAKAKIKKVMDEWKSGTLTSGSKSGPKVTNRKQAIAIALAESRKGKK